MPLCCCSLRFAALDLARHRPFRLATTSILLPLFTPPWRSAGSARRCYSLSRNRHGNKDEGVKGWYEYFDAVLEDAESSPQSEEGASRVPEAATKPTAFERARLQMLGESQDANIKHSTPPTRAKAGIKADGRQRHAQSSSKRSSTSLNNRKNGPWTFKRPSELSTTVFFYGRKVFTMRQPKAKARFRRQEIRARIASLKKDAHMPPKFVSIRSSQRPTAVFSIKWQSNFARLGRRYDKHLKDSYLGPSEAPVLNPATSMWVDHISDQLCGITGNMSINVLENRDVQHAGHFLRWPQIALWLLAYDKERVIDFLLATHCEPYPPILWVEDCLSLLAQDYTHANAASSHFQRLADAFAILACRRTAQAASPGSSQLERMFLASSFVRLLLPHCSNEHVNKIYRTIKLYNVKVHFNTYHHISTWFAENGHLEQGIDALLSAQDAGSDVDSIQFRKNCSTLLRRTMQHPGGLRLSLRLVDNLVAMGVKLEGQLCTIIMLNAVEAEDYNTAFLVYRLMTGQGLTPDDFGFSILLRACKANPDDVSTLTEVIQCVVESGLVRSNRVLATEILHCLALHHSRRNPATMFTVVRDAYSEMFKSQPLQKLGLPLTIPALNVSISEAKLHNPSQHAMNVMIAAYLENANDETAIQLYARWRTLLAEGDEHAAHLASTPHTATIFLGRFTRQRETLLQAARVIKDMQHPLPSTHDMTQAPPDVIAWSVFLYGFSRHGHTKYAGQVLAYMRKQGMEPTKFTLNNLVAGCAGAQDLSGTMAALRELSNMDKVYDEWTYKGLARYRNQAELKEEMRRAEYERSMDFTPELKDKLMERVAQVAFDATDEPINDRDSASVTIKRHSANEDETLYQPTYR